MGFSANGGLQFKISERFSLSAEFGIMISQRWFYKFAGSDNNYLFWSFTDTISTLYYEGENYLDIYNYSFRINPKYYLVQGKKWTPFIFAGVNINWTKAFYESTLWVKYKEIDYLPIGEPVAYNGNLENSFGIGFNPGFGVEYSPKDKLHFFLESGYYFIMLNKDHFKSPELEENFNAFVLQAGLRYCFIKSKDL
jgi:opacity protein-like surface antigen